MAAVRRTNRAGASGPRRKKGRRSGSLPKRSGASKRRGSRAQDAPAKAAPSVVEVEQARDELRAVAREALGVTGHEDASPLREGIRRSGAGWYPLVALGLLVIVDEFQGYAYFVLGPEIAEALGISRGAIAFGAALKTLFISLATLPIAAYAQKKSRRASISIATAFIWSVITLFTGFVTSVAGLFFVLIADGASTGSVRTVHRPLLFDSYPPQVRVRADSGYRMADGLGNILAPLMVGALTAILGFSWRGVFLVMGLTSLCAAFFAIRLRDPGFGRWDTGEVRKAVRQTATQDEVVLEEDVQLGFFEIVRRLLLIPTVRRILIAFSVFGMFLIPLYTFLFFYWDERWGMGPGARSVLFATLPLYAIPALAKFGPRGDAMFRRDPAELLRVAAIFLAAAVVGVALTVLSPFFVPMAIFIGIAGAMFALLQPTLFVALLSIVPPRMRPHAAALTGIAISAVGGFAGLILLGGIDRRFGLTAAILSLSAPGLLAALILKRSANGLDQDLDHMIDHIVEEEKIGEMSRQGIQLPMLACRNIDFSYGQLQVLFNVSFTVDDGELVTLLGTNGAGKSTLLRVVSGLGLPSRGSVRFRGTDITYIDAERRLRLGITQIPGGRAIFPSLTVVENMRAFGYSHGNDRRMVERGIDRTFEAFPRLGERRNQLGSTLSGGEQQMLGLGKAFMLQPRLLLIDELSLGLAPKIVSELLDMVRLINSDGTAVVLVEQSVNVALTIAQHAYFMEKGEIRFDGRAEALLGRKDLLRSVFLEGAAKGLRR